MSRNTSKLAETWFANICAGVNAIAHRPEEDLRGWDYLVEFPEEDWTGHQDTRPPAHKAFVQIKSTTRNHLSCRIKLSNALRAANSREPWFVCLFKFNSDNSDFRVYAVHVWGALFERMLMAVRRADLAGKQLNKSYITINFSDSDDRTNDLLPWMANSINEAGKDYEKEKKAFFDSCGYDGAHTVGKMTISAESVDEFVRNFLGLGEGLEVKKFSAFSQRFGLTSPQPYVDVGQGKVTITPSPAAECEFRFKSLKTFSEVISLGKVFSTDMFAEEGSRPNLRFSADGIEMIYYSDGRFNFDLDLDENSQRSLTNQYCITSLCTFFSLGGVELNIWIDEQRFIGGTLNLSHDLGDKDWQKLAGTIGLLIKAAGANRSEKILVSFRDLFEASEDLLLMQAMNSIDSIEIQIENKKYFPTIFDIIIYYSIVYVGGNCYLIITKREVKSDVLDDNGWRELVCIKPTVVGSNVVSNPSSDDILKLTKMHTDLATLLGESLDVLDVGHVKEVAGPLKG